MTMALSFRNVVGLFGKGRKYGARSRGLAARWAVRPVLEGLEERAVPSATALNVVHSATVVHACSQDHKEAIKIVHEKELPGGYTHKADDKRETKGDPAHKADDKGETKAEQKTEKMDNSTDKGSLDNSGSQKQDQSSGDPSSTSVTDQVFSSSDSQDFKDS
jgi:hypothetical protein